MSEIILRDVDRDDLPVFFLHQQDPIANQMAAFPAREWPTFVSHWERIMDDRSILKQTILYKSRVAGNVVCFELSGQRTIGYWLGREFWGKGIASRALAQFLLRLPFRPLYAYVSRHNIASYRVLEKCGFYRTSEEGEEFLMKFDG